MKDKNMPGKMPGFDQLMNPLLRALRALGGSGSVEEMFDKVVELERLPESIVSVPHNPDKSNQTEVDYRLAWARTYLKKFGLLENSSRGVWALTAIARNTEKLDPQEVVRVVRAAQKRDGESEQLEETPRVEGAQDEEWEEKLHAILTTKLAPAAFERLVQRVLRESGFTQVEVTGRSGDGGIDGRGIARVHGLLSFHVLFQCKRYKGTVGPSEIRDFRGAMVGRADKGLFLTTGVFTPGAVKEATRDGAPAIDLIDGRELAIKLKELGLGVKTEVVEAVRVEESWFESI